MTGRCPFAWPAIRAASFSSGTINRVTHPLRMLHRKKWTKGKLSTRAHGRFADPVRL